VNRARLAVLASGGGSNLQALLDYLASLGDDRAADVVLVATDRPNIGALTRAEDAGIDGLVTRSRLAPDAIPLADALGVTAPDYVVLGGYLQLIPNELTQSFRGRMVNVHPAPLPEFGGAGMYGARVHRAVLAAGTTQTGPTVHFVDEQYDHGPTIAYWPVPVYADDSEHAVAARVLRAEHLLYPRVVHALASGEIALGAGGQLAPPFLKAPLPLFDPALDDSTLVALLEHATRPSLGI
jgi:phosphoribosylglycinamide formyltransferase 1